MKCGLCGNKLDSNHPFSDPKSHKKDCKMYANDKQLIKIIKEK